MSSFGLCSFEFVSQKEGQVQQDERKFYQAKTDSEE
jgi:hypothetical protein